MNVITQDDLATLVIKHVIDFHDNVAPLDPSKLLVVPTNQKGSGKKGADMLIIGADYHPGFQQIAFVDTETGELQERRLQHREEAEKFYRDLAAQGMKLRVGMEASGMRGGLNDCSPSCS